MILEIIPGLKHYSGNRTLLKITASKDGEVGNVAVVSFDFGEIEREQLSVVLDRETYINIGDIVEAFVPAPFFEENNDLLLTNKETLSSHSYLIDIALSTSVVGINPTAYFGSSSIDPETPEFNTVLTYSAASPIVRMKESEIGLVGILVDLLTELKFKCEGMPNFVSLGNVANNYFALNIQAIRRYIFNNYNIFTSQISLYSGDNLLAEVAIIDDETNDPPVIAFRNSYGIFEKIAFMDNPLIKSEFQFESYEVFGQDSYKYFKAQSKKRRTDTLTLDYVYRSTDDINFLIDMLHQSEIYLEYNGYVRKVVSSANISYREKEPGIISVDFTVSSQYSTALKNPYEYEGVFDDTFDDTYN